MKKKAFTLIELIIVMGIISLLASIVAVKFDLVKKVKEKNEVATVLADMNYCKEKARVSGFTYGFQVEKPGTYYIKKIDGGEFEKKKVDLEVLEITGSSLDKNIDGVIIFFKPSGSVANPCSIYFKSDESTYSLSVGVSGANIQIKKK